MTSEAVPAAAIDAAVAANDAFFDADGDLKSGRYWHVTLAKLMVAAAAPHIRSAERSRLLDAPVTDTARKPISHYAHARAGHLSQYFQGYYQAMADVAALLTGERHD